MKWEQALDNIRAAASTEEAGPMIELLISKLLQLDDYKSLLSTYLPILAEVDGLPEPLKAALELANQVLQQDLRGAETFDSVLQAVGLAEKDLVIRVFLGNGNGKLILEDLRAANAQLQGRFTKALQVTKFKEQLSTVDASADLDKFVQILSGAAGVGVVEEDLTTTSLGKDFEALGKSVINAAEKILKECRLGTSFACFYSGQAMDVAAMLAFFSSVEAKNVQLMSTLLAKDGIKAMLKICAMEEYLLKVAGAISDMSALAPRQAGTWHGQAFEIACLILCLKPRALHMGHGTRVCTRRVSIFKDWIMFSAQSNMQFGHRCFHTIPTRILFSVTAHHGSSEFQFSAF